MGLDIYAGTLTRYYSHNWKTVVQQWAEDVYKRQDPDMDILKQCQKWHEESKQHKIIDALEAIPAGEHFLQLVPEVENFLTAFLLPQGIQGLSLIHISHCCTTVFQL